MGRRVPQRIGSKPRVSTPERPVRAQGQVGQQVAGSRPPRGCWGAAPPTAPPRGPPSAPSTAPSLARRCRISRSPWKAGTRTSMRLAPGGLGHHLEGGAVAQLLQGRLLAVEDGQGLLHEAIQAPVAQAGDGAQVGAGDLAHARPPGWGSRARTCSRAGRPRRALRPCGQVPARGMGSSLGSGSGAEIQDAAREGRPAAPDPRAYPPGSPHPGPPAGRARARRPPGRPSSSAWVRAPVERGSTEHSWGSRDCTSSRPRRVWAPMTASFSI